VVAADVCVGVDFVIVTVMKLAIIEITLKIFFDTTIAQSGNHWFLGWGGVGSYTVQQETNEIEVK
jgi:hypothetical protein